MPVYVVLPFYAAADGDGFRVIDVKPLPLHGDAPGQHLIASLEVGTAKLGRDQLLLGAGDSAKGDGSLRPDEVPVLPADFRTHALAGVITRRSGDGEHRSEEHTSELQSLMRISYAVLCLKKKKHT